MGAAPDATAIYADAKTTFASVHAEGKPFKVRGDVKVWVIKILHHVLLNIQLDTATCEAFLEVQFKITLLSSFVPTGVTSFVASFIDVDDLVKWRSEWLQRYTDALRKSDYIKGLGLDAKRMHILSSSILDAMLFAGGASVGLVASCALAVVYGDASPLARDAVPSQKTDFFAKQVTWECIRYFPAVVGFPWVVPGAAKNNQGSHRTILALAAALKDPRAWGEDAEEFRLRDLAEYHAKSTAFAEQAIAKEGVAGGSRSCPGQTLALVMVEEFLKAWFEQESKWTLPKEQQDKMVFTGSPTQKPDGFAFQPVL